MVSNVFLTVARAMLNGFLGGCYDVLGVGY